MWEIMDYENEISKTVARQEPLIDNLPNKAGVYKLYKQEEDRELKLLYIGQSNNIKNRVREHKGKMFDEIQIIPIEDEQRRLNVEKALIKLENPIVNRESDIEIQEAIQQYEKIEATGNFDSAVLKVANELYRKYEEPIYQHTVIKKCLEKRVINNKQTGYNALERLKEKGEIKTVDKNKQKYQRIKT